MNNWNYKSAKVGNELPSMKIDSISENTLSKYYLRYSKIEKVKYLILKLF